MRTPARINFLYITIYTVVLLTLPDRLICQVGLRTPIPYYNPDQSDSVRIVFPVPVLPLRDWHDIANQTIRIEKETKGLRIDQIISRDAISMDPLKMDYRSSSYYVPKTVRDELNLIMNRPKDNAFLPIFPVAYLAVQLAAKYLLIKQKTEITTDDIEKAVEALPVLKVLWSENPLTITGLFDKPEINSKYTVLELTRLVNLLIENKLIKPRKIENSETLYFPALSETKYHYIRDKSQAEKGQLGNEHTFPQNTSNKTPDKQQ